jgi:hypothetical protein
MHPDALARIITVHGDIRLRHIYEIVFLCRLDISKMLRYDGWRRSCFSHCRRNCFRRRNCAWWLWSGFVGPLSPWPKYHCQCDDNHNNTARKQERPTGRATFKLNPDEIANVASATRMPAISPFDTAALPPCLCRSAKQSSSSVLAILLPDHLLTSQRTMTGSNIGPTAQPADVTKSWRLIIRQVVVRVPPPTPGPAVCRKTAPSRGRVC